MKVKSVVQTSYDIVKANGGELKMEMGVSLLFNCQLSESRINGIIGLHRLPWSRIKSVKSINLCKSVIQTIL